MVEVMGHRPIANEISDEMNQIDRAGMQISPGLYRQAIAKHSGFWLY
jgi:hypothetical protein